MATVHVVLAGRNETLDFDQVFTPQRLAAIGMPDGAVASVENLTEGQVKAALAQFFDINPNEIRDHYVELNSKTGNITVRPNSGWGKRIVGLVIMSVAMLSFSCASMGQSGSNFVSGIAGLKRVVTLYSANGTVIQQWGPARYNVKTNGGIARFMDKGKAIYISGTFTIIEQ